MRVLHINTFESVGGAARAMSGLHEALVGLGVDSRILAMDTSGANPRAERVAVSSWMRSSRIRHLLDNWPLIVYRRKTAMHWTSGRLGSSADSRLRQSSCDVVHLHWVGLGMLSIRQIGRIGKPVVWTLHDSWAFTGGCHIPDGCLRYEASCGRCPQLGSRIEKDPSRRTWIEKSVCWQNLNLTLVAPSRWLASCASSSSLFRLRRIEVIPNGIDLRFFYPEDRRSARRHLGLPLETKLVLFLALHAARDRNKGLDLLLEAAGASGRDWELVVVGTMDAKLFEKVGVRAHLRHVAASNEELRLLYSAADVTAVPSRLENYPNVILESLACGTPVAAFAAGGIPEMIEPGITGFLVKPYDVDALATAISEAVRISPTCRAACREWVERRGSWQESARAYLALYDSLLR